MYDIQETGNQNRFILNTVLTWASISKAEHLKHIEKMGLLYVHHYTNDIVLADIITHSRTFWEWWVEEWFHRDSLFTTSVQTIFYEKYLRRCIWFDWHSMDALIGAGTTAQLLKDGYEYIVGIIDSQANEKQY